MDAVNQSSIPSHSNANGYLMTKRCPRFPVKGPRLRLRNEVNGMCFEWWLSAFRFELQTFQLRLELRLTDKKYRKNIIIRASTSKLGCKSLQSHKFDWFWNGCPEQLTERDAKWLDNLREKSLENDVCLTHKIQLNGLAGSRQLTESFHYGWENSLSLSGVKVVVSPGFPGAKVAPLVLVKFLWLRLPAPRTLLIFRVLFKLFQSLTKGEHLIHTIVAAVKSDSSRLRSLLWHWLWIILCI